MLTKETMWSSVIAMTIGVDMSQTQIAKIHKINYQTEQR